MTQFPLIISAPSGAGKSTIIQEMLRERDDLAFAISTTTRTIRPGETDGKEYYFVSEKEFEKSRDDDQFLEWARVHHNYYATGKKEVDRIKGLGKIPVFDVDVQGARNLRSCLPDGVFVFILPPSLAVLEKRLRNRNTDSDEQIRIRLEAARCEMGECSLFDYVVINNDLTHAVEDFKAILRSEKMKLSRMRNVVDSIIHE